jgi:hypothetical protein
MESFDNRFTSQVDFKYSWGPLETTQRAHVLRRHCIYCYVKNKCTDNNQTCQGISNHGVFLFTNQHNIIM